MLLLMSAKVAACVFIGIRGIRRHGIIHSDIEAGHDGRRCIILLHLLRRIDVTAAIEWLVLKKTLESVQITRSRQLLESALVLLEVQVIKLFGWRRLHLSHWWLGLILTRSATYITQHLVQLVFVSRALWLLRYFLFSGR